MSEKNLPSVVDKKAVEKAARTLSKSAKKLPIGFVSAATDIVNAIGNAYCEGKRTEVEIEKIHAQRDVLLADIKRRYDLYNQIFTQIFNERKDVIAKNFEIIEKGIADNNDNLIAIGLGNLSQVVTSSPFAAFSDFQKQLQSGEAFEL
ncbi:MAG: hypothetical protein ACTTKX_09925 [Treponema sp.]